MSRVSRFPMTSAGKGQRPNVVFQSGNLLSQNECHRSEEGRVCIVQVIGEQEAPAAEPRVHCILVLMEEVMMLHTLDDNNVSGNMHTWL